MYLTLSSTRVIDTASKLSGDDGSFVNHAGRGWLIRGWRTEKKGSRGPERKREIYACGAGAGDGRGGRGREMALAREVGNRGTGRKSQMGPSGRILRQGRDTATSLALGARSIGLFSVASVASVASRLRPRSHRRSFTQRPSPCGYLAFSPSKYPAFCAVSYRNDSWTNKAREVNLARATQLRNSCMTSR